MVTSVQTVEPSLQGCSSSPRKGSIGSPAWTAAITLLNCSRTMARDAGVKASSMGCRMTSAGVKPRSFSTDGLT